MSPLVFLLSLALAAEPEAADVTEAPEPVEAAGPERSVPPGVQPADWLDLAEPEVHKVGNHEVWHVKVPGVRKIEVVVYVWQGSVELYGRPDEAANALGFASVATENRDAQALEIETDIHDISLSAWGGYHEGGASVSAPAESIERGLEILGEVLHQPTYPKAEIKQHIRDKTLYLTVDGPSSLSRAAWGALANAWYPADHPYGVRPDLKQLKKLKSKDLIARQAAWRTSGPVSALVVGDVEFETLAPKLEAVLKGLGGGKDGRPEELAFDAPDATRVVAVDMPGQAQTALRLRYDAPPMDHDDEVAFDTMAWVLGGHFLSRLNANLREEKGFTYGAGASYGRQDTRGTLTVYVDVKAENTGEAIAEIQGEVARLAADGITAREKAMAKEAVLADWNGTRETARSARWFYGTLLENEDTVAATLEQARSIDELSLEDIAATASSWLVDKPHVWVVAGDRSAIESQLESLDVDVTWITPVQAIQGTFE